LSGGDLIFSGNRYKLQGGTIDFTNISRTQPVVDMAANTTINQYDIQIHFWGPADHLQTNYASDPALPPSDIINLIAFGTTSEASAGWTSNYRTASAVNAHQNISIFMAFRQTPSTTVMSTGSRAFTQTTESELRRTSWRRSRAPIKTIRLNIVSFDRVTDKHDGFALSRRLNATVKDEL